eukprot:5772026-Prymnesium_polylepis.1
MKSISASRCRHSDAPAQRAPLNTPREGMPQFEPRRECPQCESPKGQQLDSRKSESAATRFAR